MKTLKFSSEELNSVIVRVSQRLACSEEHTHAALHSQPPGCATHSMRTFPAMLLTQLAETI